MGVCINLKSGVDHFCKRSEFRHDPFALLYARRFIQGVPKESGCYKKSITFLQKFNKLYVYKKAMNVLEPPVYFGTPCVKVFLHDIGGS